VVGTIRGQNYRSGHKAVIGSGKSIHFVELHALNMSEHHPRWKWVVRCLESLCRFSALGESKIDTALYRRSLSSGE
jgi:hypothetical protein